MTLKVGLMLQTIIEKHMVIQRGKAQERKKIKK